MDVHPTPYSILESLFAPLDRTRLEDLAGERAETQALIAFAEGVLDDKSETAMQQYLERRPEEKHRMEQLASEIAAMPRIIERGRSGGARLWPKWLKVLVASLALLSIGFATGLQLRVWRGHSSTGLTREHAQSLAADDTLRPDLSRLVIKRLWDILTAETQRLERDARAGGQTGEQACAELYQRALYAFETLASLQTASGIVGAEARKYVGEIQSIAYPDANGPLPSLASPLNDTYTKTIDAIEQKCSMEGAAGVDIRNVLKLCAREPLRALLRVAEVPGEPSTHAQNYLALFRNKILGG